ncbi:glutamate--cysteine ligase [Legionella israelensis]|uniref:Glutamate--cysteine ligase n=1 Tax=Legionella israelensis TaxID=454 RepID=A0A0W0WCK3_9GAMM|nr:glutamate--cysteine ligase [Legionella israelensis]KTD29734.1 glutamate--cysteine ligase [Legionella israelensis]QBS11045.1 glutamate--cysteine ligase [Legionella israelensis]SCY02405.1 glutamate--cysteine ligase [Legionella israelensis DSM 19235]STX58545.1 glutamate--cysteine ligase [Legionella israelensis]
MHANVNPVPNLATIHKGPLHHIEEVLLNNIAIIEAWFRKKWQETPPPLTSSVDLRHAKLKLSPVDTNLFPAGFNNLNPDFLPLCIQAAQAALIDYIPDCTRILLLPESHTRNKFYMQSLTVLRDIFVKAGFIVRIGSLDPLLKEPVEIEVDKGNTVLLEPLQRQGDKVGLDNFNPCLLLLNNDLSSGVPEILQGLNQRIRPTAKLGWTSRLKSSHFQFFEVVAREFAELIQIDPWLINPYFSFVEGVDFMAQEGVEELAEQVDKLLDAIKWKYSDYYIEDTPFVAVKADSGTYGMSVMMVQSGDQIRNMNRKQRKGMAATKGSQKVERVIIQEGVHSFETMPDGAVAEPVVYMIGQYVVGGFYRVHQSKGKDENLNAPGMHFEPLAFAEPCNTPRDDLAPADSTNRFYAYGVIARLATLAAAREIAAIGGE